MVRPIRGIWPRSPIASGSATTSLRSSLPCPASTTWMAMAGRCSDGRRTWRRLTGAGQRSGRLPWMPIMHDSGLAHQPTRSARSCGSHGRRDHPRRADRPMRCVMGILLAWMTAGQGLRRSDLAGLQPGRDYGKRGLARGFEPFRPGRGPARLPGLVVRQPLARAAGAGRRIPRRSGNLGRLRGSGHGLGGSGVICPGAG